MRMMANRCVDVQINGTPVKAEVAETGLAMTLGLMFRRNLAPDSGLLLCFPRSADWAIHMWFVRFPLDVVFLEEGGCIVHIRSAHPGGWPFRAGRAVRYVLELPFGWCLAHGVGPGDRLNLSAIALVRIPG